MQQKTASKSWLLAFAVTAIVAYAVAYRPTRSEVEWGRDLTAARLAAQEQQTAVLIQFTSPGCVYCRRMEREVLANPAIESELFRFARVRVDWTADQGLALRYGIEAVPTFIALHPDGKPIAAAVGYQPVERFKDFLRRAADGVAASEPATEPGR